MTKVKDVTFYEKEVLLLNKDIDFCIVPVIFNGNWMFVRQKEKETREIPSWWRNRNETIYTCAERELIDQTWAKVYDIDHMWYISLITDDWHKSYGALYLAHVIDTWDLWAHTHIGENKLFKDLPEKLTFTDIHTAVFAKAVAYKEYMDSGEDYADEIKKLDAIEKSWETMSQKEKNDSSIKEICIQKAYIKDMEEMLDAENDIENLRK